MSACCGRVTNYCRNTRGRKHVDLTLLATTCAAKQERSDTRQKFAVLCPTVSMRSNCNRFASSATTPNPYMIARDVSGRHCRRVMLTLVRHRFSVLLGRPLVVPAQPALAQVPTTSVAMTILNSVLALEPVDVVVVRSAFLSPHAGQTRAVAMEAAPTSTRIDFLIALASQDTQASKHLVDYTSG